MVKNIAIMDTVYEELAKRKRPNESFSGEIKRLMATRGDIADFAGSWKISPGEADELKRTLKRVKQSSTRRLIETVAQRK